MKRRQLGRVNLSDPNNPKVDLVSRKAFQDDLKDFKHGERVWLETSTYYRQRSVSQNAVLHWYISEISEETGMDKDEIKEALKKKFLTVALTDKNGEIMADKDSGEVLERVKSTTELTTIEFNDFTENIRLWSNSYLNLQLPLPNESVELKFK